MPIKCTLFDRPTASVLRFFAAAYWRRYAPSIEIAMARFRLLVHFGPMLLLGLLLPFLVHASDLRQIVGVKKVWAGLYEGKQDLFNEPRLLVETGHIPGRTGVQFGVFFKLETEPADSHGTVLLRLQVYIPEPGIWDSRSQTYVHVANDLSDCVLGKPCLLGYGIDTKNEIVPGEWTLVVSFQGKELLTQRFVVDASDGTLAHNQFMEFIRSAHPTSQSLRALPAFYISR
jgi:hypothetical protein